MKNRTRLYHVAFVTLLCVIAIASVYGAYRLGLARSFSLLNTQAEQNGFYIILACVTLIFIYFVHRITRLTQELERTSQALRETSSEEQKTISSRVRMINEMQIELEHQQWDLRKFQLAVEHSSNQVVIADKKKVVIYANPALEQITGFTRQEVLGTSAEKLWQGKMDARFAQRMLRRINTEKQPFVEETRNVRKNGTEYWAQIHLTPILDEHGKVEFYVAISRDITHHRETALLKAQLDNFFELSGDLLLIGNTDGELKKISSSWSRTLGWSEQELLASPLWSFVHEEDRAATQRIIHTSRVGTVVHIKNRLLHKNGHHVWMSWSVSIIAHGTIYAIAHDVSQEEAVNQAKTEFVSLASHQLRTPLAAIGWYTEMLLTGDAGKLTTTQREYVNEVYENEQNMMELINALLNMSRLELGTFSIEATATDVASIARDVVHELKPGITKKSLVIEEHYARLPQYAVDQKLLRVVFQNVLSNAVKYTPEKGTVTVTLKTLGTQAKDGMRANDLLITVADTGFGIPKAQQHNIFGKMFRADNVKEKSVEGTGLGLYMVKAILEASGCRIWFESQENVGTTFFVVIPKAGMKKKTGKKK